MPTYEYECLACGHRFERLQRMSDRPAKTCPKCRKRKLQRLISSGGGLIFKGPGFYATDYKKQPRRARSESGAGGSDRAKRGTDKGTETPPERKGSDSHTLGSDSATGD